MHLSARGGDTLAAPRKSGLDYFPMDCDFFSDRKIKILKSRYGADGITLYLYFLCEIYQNGYYVVADEDFFYIAGDDLNMGGDKVRQVLTFLLERSLFDNKLFQSDAVLTSTGIQRRYQEAIKVRASKNNITVGKYWLLSESETKPYVKHTLKAGNSEKNISNSENNDNNSEKNTTKESKVKKSKVEEGKPSSGGGSGSVFSVFEKCGFQMTGYTADTLAELTDTYSEEWVCEALRRAAERGKKNLRYVKGILKSWQSAGAMDEDWPDKKKEQFGGYIPEPNTPKKYVPPEKTETAVAMPEEMRKKWTQR